MDFAGLIRDYLDDAVTHLGVFDSALLILEKEGMQRELIQNTLGSLHTLKGNSGMMGFEYLKTYIHQIEEILKKVLEDEVAMHEVMDALFDSANIIRESLQALEKNPYHAPDMTQSIQRLREVLEGRGNGHETQAVELSSYIGTKTDTIRVDFKRLDDLLNLVGELVIFKTRMNQIEDRIKPALNNKPLTRELNEGLQLIGRTVSELQEGIMKSRMLPVRTVFSKFPRMVRDIARMQGKQVTVSLEGEDTELDKTVIDELGEPLLHIVRNSIDHGIETPDERGGKGKNPVGKIILSASQESNYIIIKVKDDGRGIDLERVREKAIEKGLLKDEDSHDKNNILHLIFLPAFTTKEETTDLSGRGIGLDVVNRNISKLNGHVSVDTTPGHGSTFIIKLPLSLAIIPALMVETEGELYAIPMSSVDESVKVKEESIHIINNREVVRLRGRILPVVRLSQFFNLNGLAAPMKPKRLYLVVVRKSEKSLAIAVDKLRGQQEIVIKPLDDTFGKSRGIAGASISGDGKIVLIVDVLAFWEAGTVIPNTLGFVTPLSLPKTAGADSDGAKEVFGNG